MVYAARSLAPGELAADELQGRGVSVSRVRTLLVKPILRYSLCMVCFLTLVDRISCRKCEPIVARSLAPVSCFSGPFTAHAALPGCVILKCIITNLSGTVSPLLGNEHLRKPSSTWLLDRSRVAVVRTPVRFLDIFIQSRVVPPDALEICVSLDSVTSGQVGCSPSSIPNSPWLLFGCNLVAMHVKVVGTYVLVAGYLIV